MSAPFDQAMSVMSDPARIAEWRDAIAAIDAAAEAGHAGAAERRALLECRGSYRDSSWPRALDWLARAAGAGSDRAARQLLLLAEDRFEPGAAISGRDWGQVAASVDIARRLQPPANSGRTLSGDPLVHAIRGMASAAECRWLVEQASAKLGRADIYGQPGQAHEGRTNRAARLDFVNSDVVVELLRQRIANELGAPVGFFEVAQILAYRVGEEFVLHRDALDPRTLGADIARHGQRPATVLVYLNEEFEGGETSFPQLGIEHRGKTGDALIFANVDRFGQPEPRSTHAGRPPISGEKWVFSQWIRDRPLG